MCTTVTTGVGLAGAGYLARTSLMQSWISRAMIQGVHAGWVKGSALFRGQANLAQSLWAARQAGQVTSGALTTGWANLARTSQMWRATSAAISFSTSGCREGVQEKATSCGASLKGLLICDWYIREQEVRGQGSKGASFGPCGTGLGVFRACRTWRGWS